MITDGMKLNEECIVFIGDFYDVLIDLDYLILILQERTNKAIVKTKLNLKLYCISNNKIYFFKTN